MLVQTAAIATFSLEHEKRLICACALLLQTFSLHIGADLKLPTENSQRHSRFEAAPTAVPAAQAASDPFEGLPFRAWAERMGEAMSPVVRAVRLLDRTTAVLTVKCVSQWHCNCR